MSVCELRVHGNLSIQTMESTNINGLASSTSREIGGSLSGGPGEPRSEALQSTVSRLVFNPDTRIASRISLSSITMLVRTDMYSSGSLYA